ncbi:YadA-like family protein [Alkanindiges sp. WGS2144]|uniref:YadA-like family protein n=1 Tax=Alkanindiges sp. WGS2144 TaxID=3366808 RepID=UPI0037517C35
MPHHSYTAPPFALKYLAAILAVGSVISIVSIVPAYALETIADDLEVTGTTQLDDKLTVTKNGADITGDTKITGKSTVTSDSSVGGNSTVAGSATIGNGLTVNSGTTSLKNTSVGGTLNVTGATNFNSATATGAIKASSLESTGATKVGNGLTVSAGGATVTGDSSFSNKLSVTGATTLNGGLTVNGANLNNQKIIGLANGTAATDAVNKGQLDEIGATANKGWNLNTASTGSGTAIGSTKTNVAPDDEVKIIAGDNVAITQSGKNITVATSQNPNFTTVTTTGAVNSNSLAVSNNATVGGTLGVTGATTLKNTAINGTLNVTGATTLASATASGAIKAASLESTGATKVGNGLTVTAGGANITGDTKVTGKLESTSDAKVGGTLEVTGTANLKNGADVNNKKITSVAAGNIAAASSTDAVNGGQLYTANQNIATALGTTLDSTGTLVAPTYNVSDGKGGMTSFGNVKDAVEFITGANTGAGAGIKYFHVTSTAADSQAQGNESIAIGPQSVANGNSTVAMGDQAQTVKNNSISIGLKAKTNEVSSIAIGQEALTQQENSIGLGKKAIAAGKATISIGEESLAQGSGAVAIGKQSAAIRDNSTAIGGTRGVARTPVQTTDPAGRIIAIDGVPVTTDSSTAGTSTANIVAIDGVSVTPQQVTDFLATLASGANLAAGQYALAVGTSNMATGKSSVAVGDSTRATAEGAIAMGKSARASSTDSIALGTSSTVSAASALALGKSAMASGDSGVAIGNTAQSKRAGSVAVGQGAVTDADYAVSIGYQAGKGSSQGTTTDRTAHIAIGQQAGQEVTGNQNIAIGVNAGSNLAKAGGSADDNIAIGTNAGGNVNDRNISIGRDSNKNGSGILQDAVAVGYGTTALNGATVLGTGAQALLSGKDAGTNAVAVGSNAQVSGNGGVALGYNTEAGSANVALGMSSVALNNSTGKGGYLTNKYNSDVNILSVGSASQQRRIINVADGADNTDAVNVQQLKQLNKNVKDVLGSDATLNPDGTFTFKVEGTPTTVQQAIEGLVSGSIPIAPADSVTYTDTSHTKVDLQGARLSNIAAGTTANDAVNKGQLEQAIADNGVKYISVNSSQSANKNNTGAAAAESLAIGASVSTSNMANNSVAVGFGGTSTQQSNSVAIGSAALTNQVSSVAVGDNAVGYGVNNVAIGKNTRSDGKDGITIGNNAQLDPATKTVDYGVVIGSNAEVQAANQGVSIGRQAVTQAEDGTAIGHQAFVKVSAPQSNAIGYKAEVSGQSSNALGDQAKASGTNSTAIGRTAHASGTNSNAIGNAAISSASNTNAIGNQAKAEGTSANAIGDKAQVSSNTTSSTAMGTSATVAANSSNATAIGSSAQVNSNASNGLAFGNQSSVAANANNATAIGSNAQANAVKALAVGDAAQATAINATALGKEAKATEQNSVALGTIAKASAVNAFALGNTAQASGVDAIAFGTNTLSNQQSTVAVGNAAQATNKNASALGNAAQANGESATALGDTAKATQQHALALGYSTEATGAHSTAIGDKAVASKDSALAIGHSAQATGINAISIGNGNVVSGNNSGALGDPSYISGDNSYAIGNNNNINVGSSQAFIVGNNSTINNAQGAVAIGRNNTVSADNAFVLGSNVTNNIDNSVVLGNKSAVAAAVGTANASINGKTYTFAGTNPYSTVSVGDAGKERTITNVAAGRISAASTDAINGSQLYGTNEELKNLATTTATALGGGAAAGTTAGGIIAPTYTVNKNTSIKNVGAAITALDQGWTVESDGKIGSGTAVKAGDAVDIGLATGEANLTRSATTASGKTTIDFALSKNLVVDTVNAGGVKVSGNGIDANGQKISNVAAGSNPADAVNFGQLTTTNTAVNTLANTPLGFAGDTGTASRKLGETLNVKGGATGALTTNNIGVVANGTNQLDIRLAEAVNLGANGSVSTGNSKLDTNGLSVKDGSSISTTVGANGVTVKNGATETKVNAGTVSGLSNKTWTGTAVSGQAATEDQLQAVQTTIQNKGLDFAANSGSNVHRDLGQVVEVKGGFTGADTATSNENVKTITTTNGIDIRLAKDAKFDSVTAGGSTLDSTGLKTGNVEINSTTNKISGVAAGDISATSKDAINGSQLFSTNQNVSKNSTDIASNTGDITALQNQTFKLQANGDSASSVKASDTVQFKDGKNVKISRSGNDITVATADNVAFDKVTVGGVVSDSASNTISGLSNTTLGAGDFATKGRAATEEQLNVSQSNLASVLGGNAVNSNGNVTTSDIGGTGKNTVHDAIGTVKGTADTALTTANKGFNITSNGNKASDNVKLGETVDFTTGDSNLIASHDDNKITYSLSKNLDLGATGSVTTGATSITNSGLSITGGPSVTTAGIDAANKTISNVKAGTAGTDAVNLDQLNAVNSTANKGFGLQAQDGNQVHKNPGEYVEVTGADSNISTKVANGKIAIELAKNITVDSVTAGGSTLDSTGLKTGNVEINSTTNKISGVAAGDISATSKDAINGSQLFSTNQNVSKNSTDIASNTGDITALQNQTFKLQANGDSASSVKASDTVQFKDGKNVKISRSGNDITVATADNVAFDKVTVGGVVSDSASNTISGLSNTTLGAGDFATKGRAATEEQLNVSQSNLASVLGGNAVNSNGNVTTSDIGGTGKNTVHDAIGTVKGTADTALTTANKGFNITSNGNKASDNVKLGETVDFTTGDSNLIASHDDNKITYSLSKNLDLGATGSVTTGATSITNSGLSITGGPSVTTAGIDAANKTISNVKAGTAGTDAVNLDQLNAVNSTANKGFGLQAQDGNQVHKNPGEYVEVTGADSNISTKVANGKIAIELAKNITVDSVTAGGSTLDSTGLKTGNVEINSTTNKISGVAAGDISATSKDAINGSQLFSTNQNVSKNSTDIASNTGDITALQNQTFKLQANGDSASSVKASDTVQFKDGKNVKISRSGNDITVATADNVAFDKVTVGGVVSDSASNTISGLSNTTLGAGDFATKGRAATEEQLNVSQSNLASVLGGNAVNSNGNVTTSDIGGTGKNTVHDAIGTVKGTADTALTTANKGFNITSNGNKASDNVKLGETVDFTTGDSNLIASHDDNKITYSLSKNLDLGATGSVTTGATSITNSGLSITGGPSVTTAGIDAANKTISNVKAGTAGTDAVNLDQLNAVNSTANKGFGLQAQDGNQVHKNPGEYVEVTGADSNISTKVANGKIAIELAKNITVDSVTAGGSTLDSTGLKTGNVEINSTTNKISGVAAGDISATSKDAINGSQLFSTNQNVSKNSTDIASNTGDITALQNQTFKLQANGDSASSVKASDTVQFKDGKNVKISRSGNDITVATADNVAFDKVTVGGVVSDSASNTISGLSNTTLGAGDFATKGRAATEEQLNVSQSNLASVLGGNAVNSNGNVTTSDIGGTGKNTVHDAIALINQASTEAKSTVSAGDNIVVTSTANQDGSTDYQVATSKDIKVDSLQADDGKGNVTRLTAGGTAVSSDTYTTLYGAGGLSIQDDSGKSTVINNTGLSFANTKGDTIGPQITATGINAGDTRITNLADGKDATDAVNKRQLEQAFSDTLTDVTVITQDGDSTTINVIDQVVNKKAGQNPDSLFLTYDVEGQEVTDHLTIGQTVQKMNTEGIKFFHTNADPGEHGDLGVTNDSSAAGKNSTAIGVNAIITDKGESAVAIGHNATVEGAESIAIGYGAQVAGNQSISIGTGNIVNGDHSGAFGDPSTINGSGSYAVGNNNTVNSDDTFVLGNNINAAENGSVVLGTGSTATTGSGRQGYVLQSANSTDKAAIVATTSTTGAVAVGNASSAVYRQITGVAAGTQDSDAVNVAQLKAVDNALVSLTNNVNNGGLGLVQQVNKQAPITIGANTGGAVINAAGKDGNRQITGVAAGSANDHVANVGQLTAVLGSKAAVDKNGNINANLNVGNTSYATVQDALSAVNGQVGQISDAAVQYDKRADGTVNKDQVSLQGGKDGTLLTNVKAGNVAQDSKDAVNSGQLWNVQQQVDQNSTDIDVLTQQVNNGSVGLVQQADNKAPITVAKNTGGSSVSITGTDGSRTLAGVKAGSISKESTDAVNGSQLHAANTTVASALGGGASVNSNGEIIAPQYEVAGGKHDNVGDALKAVDNASTTRFDALNNQLNQAFYYTNERINKVEKQANAGIAAALSLESAPFVPGKYTYSVGAGFHGGENAVGATLRRTADNGRWSITGGVATATEGGASARVGISGVID